MCTKKRFSSRPLALQRITEIKNSGDERDKKPIRAYFCGVCGGYHLTSQPLPKNKAAIVNSRKKFRPEKIAEDWIKKKKW